MVQITATLSPGDAIGNEILTFHKSFMKWGYPSEIFAQNIHPEMRSYGKPWCHYRWAHGDVVVYHHSIGSDICSELVRTKCLIVMIYHNITPAHYLADTNVFLSELCLKGREELRMIKPRVGLALADSEFSRKELEQLGYTETHVLPILIDFHRYDLKPNQALLSRFSDNAPNILFVGRVVPNKCIHDLIKSVAIYQKCIDARIRLFIVGSCDGMEIYVSRLRALITKLELQNVFFVPNADTRDLVTYYRIATLFATMSEHEGFCVPLVESMYFGVPIVAFNSTAVPETLGGAGILLDNKDPATAAEAFRVLIEEKGLRQQIADKQRDRLRYFAPDIVAEKLRIHLEQFKMSGSVG